MIRNCQVQQWVCHPWNTALRLYNIVTSFFQLKFTMNSADNTQYHHCFIDFCCWFCTVFTVIIINAGTFLCNYNGELWKNSNYYRAIEMNQSFTLTRLTLVSVYGTILICIEVEAAAKLCLINFSTFIDCRLQVLDKWHKGERELQHVRSSYLNFLVVS